MFHFQYSHSKDSLVRVFFLILLTCAFLPGASPDVSGAPQSENADGVLSGIVTSQAEGAMEGVLVTAKRDGGNVAVTVVTDSQGRYVFPSGRLRPGRYQIRIRAVGYELEGPGWLVVEAGSPQQFDLSLRDARDLASQLSNVEWLLSVPGTDPQRNGLGGCIGCHSIGLALKSTHDSSDWVSILNRMRGYASPSFWLNPVRWPWEVEPRPSDVELGAYLSSVDRDGSGYGYELKTMPRPQGKATRVIVTDRRNPRVAHPRGTRRQSRGRVGYQV